jgi:hypothetical protein
MIVAIIAAVAILALLVGGFVWLNGRPQTFDDPTAEGVVIHFVPPIAGKRPLRRERQAHQRLRTKATDLVAAPEGIAVPTDMFWDDLLGQLCFICEEHDYREALSSFHMDRSSGVVSRAQFGRSYEDHGFAIARAAE